MTGGKLGYVIAVDPETGEEVWKTAVGTHNGHDDDSRKQLDGTLELPEPPFEVFPAPTAASRRTSPSTRARSTRQS